MVKYEKSYSLVIFIYAFVFPNIGFSDGKDELTKRINSFKNAYIEKMKRNLIWGFQLDANAIMYITEIIVDDHGIQEELIPFVSPLAEEYYANEDLVSLFIMAAMCLHYVPNESRQIILRFMMIVQAAMAEIMKENSPQKEHIFNLMSEKFKGIPSEGQAKLIAESQTVFNSVGQQHHSASNLFGLWATRAFKYFRVSFNITCCIICKMDN